MSLALDVLTILAVSAGAFFFLAGTVGLLRFPDALSRLHALTKADNLGLGLVVLGLLFQVEGLFAALKLVSVWLLTLLAGATVTPLIARTTRPGGRPPDGSPWLSIPASPCWSSEWLSGPSPRATHSPQWSGLSPMGCCSRWSGCVSRRRMWR